MPSPTASVLEGQLRNAVAALDNFLAGLTVEADLDTYDASIVSDYARDQAAGSEVFRRRVSDALLAARTLLSPVLIAYSHHIVNAPEKDVQAALSRIYDYFHANNKHVLSRGPSFGPISGTTTGDGVINRLTVDHRGYTIEGTTPDTITYECVSDAHTGARKHEEVFEFRGRSRRRHALSINGSGLKRRFRSFSYADSLLSNPSFESFTSTTAPGPGSPQVPTDVTDWTVDTIASCQIDVDHYYKQLQGVATPHSLRFTGDNGIEQKLTVNNVSVQRFRPYYLEFAVMREGGADGTLTLTLGSQSITVDVATLPGGTWTPFRLTLDKRVWPLVWNQNDAKVRLAWSGRSVGTILIDDSVFVPMFPFDGLWYAPVGGATPFVVGDTKTSTVSFAGDSKVQKWLWRAYGRYLPHVPGATEITASGGRTLTFASNGGADTITASSGDFDADGYKPGMLVTIAGSSSNNMTTGPIASVTATVLTFGLDTSLVNEGPVNATTTLNATPSLPDPA